jgi:hypothetical protein
VSVVQSDPARFRRWVTLAGAYASAAAVPALAFSGLVLGVAGLARAGPVIGACGALVAVFAAALERRRADHAEERLARIRARSRVARSRAEEELTGLRRQVRLLEAQLWDRRWGAGYASSHLPSAGAGAQSAEVVDLRGIAGPADPPVTEDPAELDDRVYAELEAADAGDELSQVMEEPGRRPPPAPRPATRPAGRAAGPPRDRPGKRRTA